MTNPSADGLNANHPSIHRALQALDSAAELPKEFPDALHLMCLAIQRWLTLSPPGRRELAALASHLPSPWYHRLRGVSSLTWSGHDRHGRSYAIHETQLLRGVLRHLHRSKSPRSLLIPEQNAVFEAAPSLASQGLRYVVVTPTDRNHVQVACIVAADVQYEYQPTHDISVALMRAVHATGAYRGDKHQRSGFFATDSSIA